jgi:carboxypeptidase Taq
MADATAAYDQLLVHSRGTFLLTSTSALLGWDQEVCMPPGGGELRSKQLALLAELAHRRATDERVGGWLATCAGDAGLRADAVAAANVQQWRRDFDRATRLPGTLVAELAEVESRAQQEWATARQNSDFAHFRPWLERMVSLQRQKAECLRAPGQPLWDALADLYEPGMNQRELTLLFAPLRQRLTALLDRLRGGRAPTGAFARHEFDEARQEAFVRAVLAAIGFDGRRGRLDRSAHPFCTGAGGDVRLTTRFHKDNVLDALSSTMHEGGHGLYEQGMLQEHLGTPLGEAASLGIHESQSRLYENQVGRSRAFWSWCRQRAREHLGVAVDPFPAEAIYRDANRVAASLIRVEADECTYNLHVMVRFQLEPQLLSGELPVADLPAAWNAAYQDHLGVAVPDDRRGCLQDVHWSCGLFGYFPTYTLGNLYAAQLAAAAARALGDLDGQLARGEFAPLRGWLREHVHRHGRRHEPAELCRLATGAPLSSEPFLAHLERKLTGVYGA